MNELDHKGISCDRDKQKKPLQTRLIEAIFPQNSINCILLQGEYMGAWIWRKSNELEADLGGTTASGDDKDHKDVEQTGILVSLESKREMALRLPM